jgi:HNH endonuclease
MKIDEEKYCPQCNALGELQETESAKHYLQCVRPSCGKWLDWVQKPKNENKQNRTEHKKLMRNVHESMRSFCWNCNRHEEWLKQLKPALHLEVHHIVEVCNGGQDNSENLQVLCNECHLEVHRRRELHQRYQAYIPTTNQ